MVHAVCSDALTELLLFVVKQKATNVTFSVLVCQLSHRCMHTEETREMLDLWVVQLRKLPLLMCIAEIISITIISSSNIIEVKLLTLKHL